MGFDIFVIAPAEPFDREIAEKAFDHIATDVREDFWNLYAPDGSLHLANVFIRAEPRLQSFMVARPPWTDVFWTALHEVLRRTPTMLVWPCLGKPGYCVANPDWRSYVPPEYVEDEGLPAFAASYSDIPKAIEASDF